MSVHRLIAAITERRITALGMKAAIYPRNNPIASDLGPCTRETALSILHWQSKPAFEADLLARFARGSLLEDAILCELGSLGFTVRVERKPFEVRGRDGSLLMRGKIDGDRKSVV